MEFNRNINEKLYPVLPNAPSDVDNNEGHISEGHIAKGHIAGHAYRLQKVSEIQKEIESEKEKRMVLSKKYHRAVRIITSVGSALQASGIAHGTIELGFLATIVAAPVVIACESVALGAGFLSIVGGQVNKKLSRKAEKHEKIKVLAESKLNTISDYISNALKDGFISNNEYKLILGEFEKFKSMLEEIKTKVRGQIGEVTKESLINQGEKKQLKRFKIYLKNHDDFSWIRRI